MRTNGHSKKEIMLQLQGQILQLQGFKKPELAANLRTGLGPIEQAFPFQRFPTGAVHEFISQRGEEAAATNAFMTGLLAHLTGQQLAQPSLAAWATTPPQGHSCLWISNHGERGHLFPPAMSLFHLAPQHILFIDLKTDKEVLWALEEALACGALAVVVAELRELSFTQSRRLQLATEKSKVTGFVHRHRPRQENTVACVSRWKIKPLPSLILDDLPGVGHPAWQVQLARVRNGTPGQWPLAWADGRFYHLRQEQMSRASQHQLSSHTGLYRQAGA